MRTVNKLLTLVAASLALILPPAVAAWAIPLSNTDLTPAAFASIADQATGPITTLTSTFTIGGETTGSVESSAFAGIGPAMGDFIYTYKIAVAEEGEVTALSVRFGKVVSDVVLPGIGLVTSFFIDGTGDVAPSESKLIGGRRLKTEFEEIDEGEMSTLFGAISVLGPGVVAARIFDGDDNSAQVDVVAPVPEPSTLVLLGSGLIGAGVYWQRRRKRGLP